jgi:hypothetical protein
MAPQRKDFSKSFDLTNMSVTISTPSRSETYLIEGMPKDTVDTLTLSGLAQVLAEKCESSAGSLTEDEKWAAMNEVYASLQARTWSLMSEGQDTLLVRALCELAPHKTHVEIRAEVERWTVTQRIDVAMNPKVSTVLRRMESEPATDIDSDYLLEGLGIQRSAPAEPKKPWWKW